MSRISPAKKIELPRAPWALAAALSALGLALGLGYRLDWAPAAPAWEFSSAEEADAPETASEALAKAPPAALPKDSAPAAVDPEAAAWEMMTDDISRLAARHPGRVAVFLKDMKTSRTWTYHPDDLFPSASLIKLPLMACVFSKIRDGRLSLNEKLTLRRHNRVGGSGSLKWHPDGTRISVRDLLYLMIDESDNTATAMVIEALGISYIQQQFSQMGLFYTEIYPEGMSLKAGRVAHENYTTAREMAMLLEKIYHGDMVDRSSSELMMDILKRKRPVASRLAKGLPPGWEIAHKTGLLRQACHDSAIILTPRGDFMITVLTGQNSNYKAAKEFISRLGRVAYKHYRGENYFAKGSNKRQVALR